MSAQFGMEMSRALTATEPGVEAVTLRISGGKPIRFQARLLAEATSLTAGAPVWTEVVLYQRDSADFAIGIKTCFYGDGNGAIYHAMTAPTLESALTFLQEFDPTSDLSIDIDASDRRISTTDIALRAASLRQRADWLNLQYRAMIGELLYRIDLGE